MIAVARMAPRPARWPENSAGESAHQPGPSCARGAQRLQSAQFSFFQGKVQEAGEEPDNHLRMTRCIVNPLIARLLCVLPPWQSGRIGRFAKNGPQSVASTPRPWLRLQ
jgi:hypothetical protein